jgi:predicted O-methyltransferase YrrM
LKTPSWRARRRRLVFGLRTLLGAKAFGFFIPYRHAATVDAIAYETIEPLFRAKEPSFGALMRALDALRSDLLALGGTPPAPRFEQSWFPRLDAAIAYTIVRIRRPRRIVEIGSGHSTRFLARAIRDGDLPTRLTAIDPAPRAPLAGLDVEQRRELLHQVPAEVFGSLGPDDVLFVDSSHILMPGTDVDRLVNQILPRLAEGVLLHVHDVFLPDPYPARWAWRGYNEQTAVAPLIWTGAFELLWASHYVASRRPDWMQGSVIAELPLLAGAVEGSLWLRKAGPPMKQ